MNLPCLFQVLGQMFRPVAIELVVGLDLVDEGTVVRVLVLGVHVIDDVQTACSL